MRIKGESVKLEGKLAAVVRALGALTLLAAAYVTAFATPACPTSGRSCPSYALNSDLVLRLECGGAVLVAGVVALSVFTFVVVLAWLPTSMDSRGLSFSDAVRDGGRALEEIRLAMELAVERLDQRIIDGRDAIDALRAQADGLTNASNALAELGANLAERVGSLEATGGGSDGGR